MLFNFILRYRSMLYIACNFVWFDICCCYCRHGSGIKHFNILRHGESFFVREQCFKSIEDVIRHFQETEVPNEEGVLHVKLRYPITCNTCSRPDRPVSESPSLSSRSPSLNLSHGSGSSSTLPPDWRSNSANFQRTPSGSGENESIRVTNIGC